MQYTVSELAKLSGVSKRTLHYYDEIGLLAPEKVRENGYRLYTQKQVDRLQQILLYREMDLPLAEIKKVLDAPEFDQTRALAQHLEHLQQRKMRMEVLIEMVRRSIRARKGETIMKDTEKFEGFKQRKINENEARYGAEVRAQFGDAVMDASNAKLAGMTQDQWACTEQQQQEIDDLLQKVMQEGDVSGEAAHRLFQVHQAWICAYWKEYSPRAHAGLAQMYVDDERFRAYYEQRVGKGAAEVLRDVIVQFAK